MGKPISGNTSSKGASTLQRSPWVSFHPRSELNGLTLQDRTREPAPGCLSSTGIHTLCSPKALCSHRSARLWQLSTAKSVDLCNTMIEEVFLPTTLHTIRVKAFMSCAALVELAIPPALKYIGSGAFLDCTALRRLVKMPGTRRWRGVYAEENAFAICPAWNGHPGCIWSQTWATPLV